MRKLSLNKASKEAAVAKATLLDAIKKGKMSAPKNEKGHYEIDPAELFRVFPAVSPTTLEKPIPTPIENHLNTSTLEREVELLREMLDETRADRDQWRDQAQKITGMIEDARPAGFWVRLFGK